MKAVGVRELRSHLSSTLGRDEPVLVTRRCKISGLYLPLVEPGRLPAGLRRAVAGVLGQHLARRLELEGGDEEAVWRDFGAHRRHARWVSET